MAKNVLMGRFGNRWNTQWAQAGFINHSIAIPANNEARLALALRLVGFFTANPSYEVPPMKVTAAQGTALRDASLLMQETLATATVTLNNIGITWTGAYTTLTDDMRALIKILEAILDPDDPRWLAFGAQHAIEHHDAG